MAQRTVFGSPPFFPYPRLDWYFANTPQFLGKVFCFCLLYFASGAISNDFQLFPQFSDLMNGTVATTLLTIGKKIFNNAFDILLASLTKVMPSPLSLTHFLPSLFFYVELQKQEDFPRHQVDHLIALSNGVTDLLVSYSSLSKPTSS